MSHVLTLIGPSGTHERVAAMAGDLYAAIPVSVAPVWLSPEACDIAFEPADEGALTHANALIATIPPQEPIDSFIQPIRNRRKRMLMADMDSTIIQQECLDEVAAVAGIGEQIAGITERAMRGELPFEEALRERIGLLRGFPEAQLQAVLDERITLTPGARLLTATMRAHGARAVLVSGGFTFFTSAVARLAGFNADHANQFVIEDGAITGVADPILGREAKLATMKKEAAGMAISLDEVIAVGDGANDLAMLKAAGLGVAFRAKPLVAKQADAKLSHSDLTGLLFLQGYNIEEFSEEIPERAQ
jgi:phosphoserine phosphatase